MALPLVLARTFKEAHAFAKDRLGLRIGHYRVVNDAGTIKAVRGTQLYLVPGWDKRPDRFKMVGAMRFCRLEIVDVAEQDATKIEVTVVPDSVEPPQSHVDLVAKVLPGRGTDFFDGVADVPPLAPEEPEPTATCVECGLTPHADDCPTYLALVAEGEDHMEAASNTLETEIDEPYVDETGGIPHSAPADLEPALEPEGWEPPGSLDAEQVLRLAAGESGADVAPMEDRTPTVVSDEAEKLAAEKPKARRRSKCKKCGVLHYKDEPCPSDEE